MPASRKELDEEIVAVYRAMLADPDVMPHLKLGAAKALDAHLVASAGESERALADPESDEAPDPMEDLDVLEAQRRKRARRAA